MFKWDPLILRCNLLTAKKPSACWKGATLSWPATSLVSQDQRFNFGKTPQLLFQKWPQTLRESWIFPSIKWGHEFIAFQVEIWTHFFSFFVAIDTNRWCATGWWRAVHLSGHREWSRETPHPNTSSSDILQYVCNLGEGAIKANAWSKPGAQTLSLCPAHVKWTAGTDMQTIISYTITLHTCNSFTYT